MFEDIGKKIVGFGNGIKRGTQTFSETVSLNAKIDECRKELANCYSQLGQNYYERNKNNAPAEYQGVFSRITMLNQTIIQCQEQIKVIKGVRQCPNCGADVASNVMFCGNCGYSMPPAAPAQNMARGGVCTNCGAPLEADAAFCTTCGTRVQAPAQPQISEPVNEAAGKRCHKCGAQLAQDAVFCNNCGASLLAEEAAPQEDYMYRQVEAPAQEEVQAEQPAFDEVLEFQPGEQPNGEAKEEIRFCPNCGTKLEGGALFCAECGTKVD